MLKASFGSLKLLKYVLFYTGEKEVGADDKEVNSVRRLNGEESAQRRFFVKAFDPIEKEVDASSKTMVEEFEAKVSKKREALKDSLLPLVDEADDKYNARIDAILNKDPELLEDVKAYNAKSMAVTATEHTLNIEDKTKQLLAKYFKEFGDKVGFAMGDDEQVSELSAGLL